MKTTHFSVALVLLLGALAATPSGAQSIKFTEDFTGAASANPWYFFLAVHV